MNIAEAVKKAQEINGYIANENFNGVFIKPTNTWDRCIVCMTPDKQRRGWQPGAAELVSDEWNVFTEEDFLSPSVNHNIFHSLERSYHIQEECATVEKKARNTMNFFEGFAAALLISAVVMLVLTR